jgi:uncharacterized membrane protein
MLSRSVSYFKISKAKQKLFIMKIIFIFCAACCFLAILKFPIGYYTFLRILVSVGALLAIYNFQKIKVYGWVVIFAIILVLFNPLFPIYLYRKIIWMPLDILTALLFLLVFFRKQNENNNSEEVQLKEARNYKRDHIISSLKTKTP